MLVTKQSLLDDWFEKAVNTPATLRWLWPRTHLTPPSIHENTWTVMHFLVGDALVTLRLDRSILEATIVMYNSGKIADGAAALDEAIRIGYNSAPWRALRSACCVTNERSMNLNTKVFGKPWGISEKSAWDAGAGDWVDEAHFRRLRETWAPPAWAMR